MTTSAAGAERDRAGLAAQAPSFGGLADAGLTRAVGPPRAAVPREDPSSDAEDRGALLALLARAIPLVAAATATVALLARYGSLAAAVAAPRGELAALPDVGPAAAELLAAARSIAVRIAAAPLRTAPLLNNWDRLTDYLIMAMGSAPDEHFHVLYLDTKNRLIADEAQARGTVNHTPVYPREVVKRALELRATALIMVHNHPSGDPTPSRADVEMTAEVKAAAAALGIALHDHLVIGNGRWTSFRREGLL